LNISKGIVEAHGGRIRASSPGPGQGATVEVELDTCDAAPATPVSAEPSLTVIAEPGDRSTAAEPTLNELLAALENPSGPGGGTPRA
jgi:hypothetical protein